MTVYMLQKRRNICLEKYLFGEPYHSSSLKQHSYKQYGKYFLKLSLSDTLR